MSFGSRAGYGCRSNRRSGSVEKSEHGRSSIVQLPDVVAGACYTAVTVRFRRFAVAAILAICIGGPVVEVFDQWDDTLQDGSDTEANVVIAALCIGIAVAI